jgi:hypothetical protein
MTSREERALKTLLAQGDDVWSGAGMRMLSLAFLAVVFLTLSRAAHPQTLEGSSPPQTAFVLTIQDELISLSATEASLKAVLAEIGHRMDIPVKVDIPASAKVTLAFEQLPLPEVLNRLGKYVNYGYLQRWEHGELRISAITVHSLKVHALPTDLGADISRQPPPAKAMELEIDPRQFLKQKRQ